MVTLFVTICVTLARCGPEMMMQDAFPTVAACETFVDGVRQGEEPPRPYGLLFRCAPDV